MAKRQKREKGTIVKSQGTRSYVFQSESQGTYRRNRKMILPMPSQKQSYVDTPKAATIRMTVAKISTK